MIHMNKLGYTILLSMLVTTVLPTVSMADAKKGHRLYKKKLQKKCNFAGSIFARHHTQDEWEKINEDGDFKEETKKICPKIDVNKLNEKQWNDLYDFTYLYAIGGEVPNGCDPK